jgi:hypothetical protein
MTQAKQLPRWPFVRLIYQSLVRASSSGFQRQKMALSPDPLKMCLPFFARVDFLNRFVERQVQEHFYLMNGTKKPFTLYGG